jgi:hypothetical protein
MAHLTDEQRALHIKSFAELVKLYREVASDRYVPVQEQSLKDLYDVAGVSIAFNPYIQAYLKQHNYLDVKGLLRGMSYKWIELASTGKFKDAELLATEMFEAVYPQIYAARQAQQARTRKVEKVEDVKRDQHTSKAVVQSKPQPKQYDLGETALMMINNEPTKVVVVKKHFHIGAIHMEDYSTEVDTSTIEYAVWLPNKTIKDVSSAELYPSIDLLLEGLRVKYNKK